MYLRKNEQKCHIRQGYSFVAFRSHLDKLLLQVWAAPFRKKQAFIACICVKGEFTLQTSATANSNCFLSLNKIFIFIILLTWLAGNLFLCVTRFPKIVSVYIEQIVSRFMWCWLSTEDTGSSVHSVYHPYLVLSLVDHLTLGGLIEGHPGDCHSLRASLLLSWL